MRETRGRKKFANYHGDEGSGVASERRRFESMRF